MSIKYLDSYQYYLNFLILEDEIFFIEPLALKKQSQNPLPGEHRTCVYGQLLPEK